MYDRKNMKVIDGSVIIKIVTILLLLMTLLLLSSDRVFALGEFKQGEYYEDYTIVGYKVARFSNLNPAYTVSDAYKLGDVLCIRFFQTQYPFAAASFNLLSIGIK